MIDSKKIQMGCRTLCHCGSVRYTNYPYKEATVVACPDCTNKTMSNYYCKYCQEAVIDNGHGSTHTCKKGAYILPTPDGKFECLCGATYEYYMCRCVSGCGEDNLIDTKGRLICK